MTYAYHMAKAHQEELLREVVRGQDESGAQAPEGKSLLKSLGILNQRLASSLPRRSAKDAPTTA